MNDTARKTLVAECEGAGLDPQLLALLEDPAEPFDDELRHAVANPRTPEAFAAIARRTKARRKRLAREPRRFTVRRLKADDPTQAERAPHMQRFVGDNSWSVTDATRPNWVMRAEDFEGAILHVDRALHAESTGYELDDNGHARAKCTPIADLPKSGS